jgi:hypothetical protein
MEKMLKRGVRLGVIVSLPATLLSLSLPISPVHADSGNQYGVCVRELTNNGVPGEQAGSACAGALIPKELSFCVNQIKQGTQIAGLDAVKACYRVRRPVDLANCVVDIYRQVPTVTETTTSEASATTPPDNSITAANRFESVVSGAAMNQEETPDTLSLMVLDSCRRSLLPGPYSECVIAVSNNVQGASPAQALQTCLAAQDFPRDLFPAYTQN